MLRPRRHLKFDEAGKPVELVEELVLRIDDWLFRGQPFADESSVDRMYWMLLKRELVKKVLRKPGREELPHEAYWPLKALDQIYAVEQQKPKGQRRSQRVIVRDYLRTALMATLVTPEQLLALWRRQRRL